MFNILALVGGAPARLAGVCEAGPGETRDEEGKRLTASRPDVFGVTTKVFPLLFEGLSDVHGRKPSKNK